MAKENKDVDSAVLLTELTIRGEVADKRQLKMETSIDKLFVLFFGNGHPEKGIAYKLTGLLDWMEIHKEEHELEKVKELEKEEERIQKTKNLRSVAWDLLKPVAQTAVGGIILLIAQALA